MNRLLVYMSNSIAAAKRRRAGVIEPPPPPSIPVVQSNPLQTQNRLTLPQVISMFDTRLSKLENSQVTESAGNIDTPEGVVSISEYVVEMDHKFGVLVEEITNLKDIVLKLQSYTMDVNKMLIDDRKSEFNILPEKEEDEGK